MRVDLRHTVRDLPTHPPIASALGPGAGGRAATAHPGGKDGDGWPRPRWVGAGCGKRYQG